MWAWPSVSHQGCGNDGRGPAPPGPVSSLMPLPGKGLATDTHKHEKQTSVICQLNRGSHCNCPARKFARVISFQTTPSFLSEFWLFLSALVYFSPFTVCLFSLLCPVWAVSDARKKSEAHTAPCIHRKPKRKPPAIKPLRLLCNSLSSLLYLQPGEKGSYEGEKFTRTHAYLSSPLWLFGTWTGVPSDPAACHTLNNKWNEWKAPHNAGRASTEVWVVFMVMMIAMADTRRGSSQAGHSALL